MSTYNGYKMFNLKLMMMKKVTYLFVLMFSLVLMSTSCCKPDDDTPLPNVITVNDLVGNWNFVSLTFNAGDGIKVYDTPTELDALDVNYNYIQLSFKNVSTTQIGLLDHRGSNEPASDIYTLSNNQINFRNGFLVFSIENSETFDGTSLELKLISSNGKTTPAETGNKPIGGIYTLSYSSN